MNFRFVNIGLALCLALSVGCTNAIPEIESKIDQASNKNSAPTVDSSACPSTLTQDHAYACSPLGTDADGDAISWSLDSSTTCSWIHIDGPSGTLSGTPDNTQVGSCVLAFKASDGKEDSTVTSISLTVNNQAPTLSITSESNTVTEDMGQQSVRTASAVVSSEKNLGAVFTETTSIGGSPKCSDHGTVQIDRTSGAISLTPAADFNGLCYIGVQVEDGNGGSATATVSVSVSPVNDAPVLSASCATSVMQDSVYSCSVSATDADGDGVSISLHEATNCPWASFNAGTNQITGVPNDDQVGTCTLAIQVSDGSLTDTESFVVTVNNVIPTLTLSNTNPSINEDSGTLVLSDLMIQSSEEGFGVFAYAPPSSGADCAVSGTLNINSTTGALSFLPSNNYNGICKTKIVFSDGNGGMAGQDLVITVNPVNDAPVVSSVCSGTATVDSMYTCVLSATDPDGPSLTWSLAASGPTNTCPFTISGNILSGIPIKSESCTISVVVSDGLVNDSYSTPVSVGLPTLNLGTGFDAAVYSLVAYPSTEMFFVGGIFSTYKGQAIDPVTRLKASGTPDSSFVPPSFSAGGMVTKILHDPTNNTLYVGGSFTISGTYTNLVRLDATTGNLDTNFKPNPNDTVWDLAISGGKLYVAGEFTQIGQGAPQNRKRVAELDIGSNVLSTFNSSLGFNNAVYTIAVSGTTLYAGGSFTTYNGTTRNRAAAVNITTSSVITWNPNVSGNVMSILVNGSDVVLGGSFTTVGGSTRNHLALVNGSTGAVQAWNPNSDGYIMSLTLSGSKIIAVGGFGNVSGAVRGGLALFDSNTYGLLNLSAVQPTVDGDINAAIEMNGRFYLGGNFTVLNGVARKMVGAVDPITGVEF